MKFNSFSWKKILNVSLWLTGSTLLCVALGFVNNEESLMPCKDLKITVDSDASGTSFIEADDIKEILSNKVIATVGASVGSIHTGAIEKLLNENPYILNNEVFMTIDGELQIEVRQRKPLFRIINGSGESYYIDENGCKMPLSDKYFARLPVVSGNVRDKYLSPVMKEVINTDDTLIRYTAADSLYTLMKFIHSSDFLMAQAEQINVNADHEFELIPKVGRQVILIGDISNLDDKLFRLITFYKQGMRKTGWETYSLLNLKYKDEVVCTRSDFSMETPLKSAAIKIKEDKPRTENTAIPTISLTETKPLNAAPPNTGVLKTQNDKKEKLNAETNKPSVKKNKIASSSTTTDKSKKTKPNK